MLDITKTIATLLTCHNRRANTLACLEALYACELPQGYALDVFLLDDGSTDGTGDAVRKHYPAVNVIQGDGNLYWNRGMHLAWETAAKSKEFDYYIWLNDDTTVFKNCLTALLFSASSTNNKAIIVGTTCAESDQQQITYGGRTAEGELIVPTNETLGCNYFNGNIVLIPHMVYKKVGLNDYRFHHALGDFDYGLRASKMGIKLFVAPNILGFCEKHPYDPKWRNTNLPIYKRIRALYTPLGNNPIEFFGFDSRHYGYVNAIKHFISLHLRAFFPKLWH